MQSLWQQIVRESGGKTALEAAGQHPATPPGRGASKWKSKE